MIFWFLSFACFDEFITNAVFSDPINRPNHCFSDSLVKKNCTLAPGFWVGLTVFDSNGDSGHLCREDQVSLTHLDPPTFLRLQKFRTPYLRCHTQPISWLRVLKVVSLINSLQNQMFTSKNLQDVLIYEKRQKLLTFYWSFWTRNHTSELNILENSVDKNWIL